MSIKFIAALGQKKVSAVALQGKITAKITTGA